jgi:hypothetical protein
MPTHSNALELLFFGNFLYMVDLPPPINFTISITFENVWLSLGLLTEVTRHAVGPALARHLAGAGERPP